MAEVRRDDATSSASAVRVGEVRQRRRTIEQELVRMTGEFEQATEVPTPGRPFVPALRSKRAALLEELFRIRTGETDAEGPVDQAAPVGER
jgi:hypothetical protein